MYRSVMLLVSVSHIKRRTHRLMNYEEGKGDAEDKIWTQEERNDRRLEKAS
jgi:hypothetical protein